MTDLTTAVHLSGVGFTWPGDTEPVLCIPEFAIAQGERLFLQGPSGSGKTTLLSLIAAVLSPDKGQVVVDGVVVNDLWRGQRDQFRVNRIGLVFQQFNLLPFLSVHENVVLPCRFSKQRRQEACKDGQTLANEVRRLLLAMRLNPDDIQHRSVNDLSVGQQQRVAVARALIGRPPLIIADEPTSSLDSDSRQAFLDLLFTEVKAAGSTLLFVSHDASLASSFDRHVDLREINQAAVPDEMTGALR